MGQRTLYFAKVEKSTCLSAPGQSNSDSITQQLKNEAFDQAQVYHPSAEVNHWQRPEASHTLKNVKTYADILTNLLWSDG